MSSCTLLAEDTPAGFIRCCHKFVMSHAYIKAHWRHNGVQCCDGNGADVDLYTCNLCGTTRGIEVPCPHGKAKP